jgi:chromosomal replication initiator protein
MESIHMQENNNSRVEKVDGEAMFYGRDFRQIWQTALRDLSQITHQEDFNSWIRSLTLLDLSQGVATLLTPSSFAKRHLETNYLHLLKQSLSNLTGEPVEIRLVVEQPTYNETPPKPGNGIPGANSHIRFGTNQAVSSSYNLTNNGNGKYHSPSPRIPNIPNNRGRTNYQNGNFAAPMKGITKPAFANDTNYESDPEMEEVITGPMPPVPQFTEAATRYSYSKETGLNPKYVFENYVKGGSNRMACAAAEQVSENPGLAYNPLFIYGSVGVGKTHLLHAIGHKALQLRPNLAVLYVTSEKFTNDLINAIRDNRTEQFREHYRSIDILLIDDIQFIAGKEATQEEFFHTFNALYTANKQIVVTSDRAPKAMLVLEDRLRSRFEGGLISDVGLPDYEMRLLILQAKARYQAIPVTQEVLEFIARQVQSNIRELEGALTRVTAFAMHNNTSLTVDVAALALNEIMLNTRRQSLKPERIIDVVSQYFNVDVKEMQGRSRSQDIVLPRQVAMYIIREQTDSSLVEIGQKLGGRDHTTVMHAIDKIEHEYEVNNNLRSQVNAIVQYLHSDNR